ncbi:MAG TPA: response regulator [Gaiellaceae bacterium]
MSLVQSRILVVDDDQLNRAVLTRSLENEGHRVAAVASGEEALGFLRASPADVVLLDIVMPGLSGVEVLEELKADPSLRQIPVIMISALDDYESVVRCIEVGAEDYLPKPFDPVLLRARINAGLSKARLNTLERERVRGVFARFLPETVVDELMARDGHDPRLGGVRLVGTVLFSDLRGFTTFAEATPPDRVVEVLNRYFSEMSDAILDQGGTLLGYLGDGLLAVFGAPIRADDHADRALAAAREMLWERLPRFNEWLRDEGIADGFRMGIGVSSGPFMSGNVGSDRRLEYMAVGDTVNTASRLESLTKEHPHAVLVSDSTRSLLIEPDDGLVFVDELRLRGKSEVSKLWALSG